MVAARRPHRRVDAHLTEFAIELSSAQIGAGGTITVHNGGTTAHDLAVRTTELTTGSIEPGATATLDVSDLEPGTYELICTIPGHVGSGMTTPLVIGDGATTAPAAAGAHAGHDALTPEQGAIQDAAMMDSIKAFPAATAGKGNQVLEPTILPDGTKHFELTAAVIDWEVTPGNIVQAWAYNGQVPGPRFDLEVGDTVEVTIHNELPLGTDIHWHGINTPNDQDGVAPITQDLRAARPHVPVQTVEPAIGMYHAHAHGEQAVPNGMFGTFIGDVPVPAGRTVSGIAVPADVQPCRTSPWSSTMPASSGSPSTARASQPPSRSW